MHKTNGAERSLDVSLITRVEGEGSLHLLVQEGKVAEARLSIFEAPRYFEKLVEGRTPQEVIDIVARICGICPVAYQMTAVQAFEDCFGIEVAPETRALRRLMYCGEWIESHALHLYMLQTPDFLGYPSAVAMAQDHRDLVANGLRVKKMGNTIIECIGGRAIHPVSLCVGGFTHLPSRKELDALRRELDAVIPLATDTLRWTGNLTAPPFTRETLFVSLFHPHEYPMNEGRIVSSGSGSHTIDLAPGAWADAFHEIQLEGTNALHARTMSGETYAVGPPARIALCGDQLHPEAHAGLSETGLREEIARNPHWGIAARAAEILHALCEARDIAESYRPPAEKAVPWTPRAGIAAWTTEAPRGTLYHRYLLDEEGKPRHATIIPPTSQNQGAIEHDLVESASGLLHLSDEKLTAELERLVRSYDPCISCATHFLAVTVEDTPSAKNTAPAQEQ